ncbi:MAG TPA: hypothetical protein VHE35_08575 [Kofleriaceae bacterium]|nr:hypothetical protein [Kofleriaceae bacterium]
MTATSQRAVRAVGARTGRRAPSPGRARGAALSIALSAAAAFGAACHTEPARSPATRISARDAIVRVKTAVPDAGLWIDGKFIGAVGELHGGVALAPGAHRLELRHEAYFVHYQELDLTAGQRLTLDIDLAPLLP